MSILIWNYFYIFYQVKINLKIVEKKNFEIVNFNNISTYIKVFNLLFINKIKNISINNIFKNSYFVIKIYNNNNKNFILI